MPAESSASTFEQPQAVRMLRGMALRGLSRMYDRPAGRFVFRVRGTSAGEVMEGHSLRYTAISLIGLAGEGEEAAARTLGGARPSTVCTALVRALPEQDNLGDVALTLWACRALRHRDWERALRRLVELRPLQGARPTVELAWTLAALCVDAELPAADLRAAVARRLLGAFAGGSALFPHVVGASRSGLRAHVCCFADLAYPIHALSRYGRLTGDRLALFTALRCAEAMVAAQGPQGQWWWHYDVRTGSVVEPFPVYAVHQDAMAPMALFALADATGEDFDAAVARGLDWLISAPELAGGSLIDAEADLVWRKVARREPRKLARSLQAMASRVHPDLRVPGLDAALPAGTVDREDRPYHLGWVLHAWPESRLRRVHADLPAVVSGPADLVAPAKRRVRSRDLFGIPVAPLTAGEVLGRVEAAVRSRDRLHLGVVNAAKVVNMRRDPSLREDVLASDLILADGVSVVWASRLLRRPVPERVTGIDLMNAILAEAPGKGYRIFCLGATPEVLEKACARMLADHPGLSLVGRHHGHFTDREERQVAAQIAAARPDVLFVGMTSPRKERFLARWSPRLGVPVCHGVGGSFDVLAGKVRRAPRVWQRLGLEWLYRVGQEPRRLWKRYLVTNTAFCWMLLLELVRWRAPVELPRPRPVDESAQPR
jgi:N-acetylglucosaminyldiphosphoundecaprenol N-acetyl-beta-D-mannosaminyltransferase